MDDIFKDTPEDILFKHLDSPEAVQAEIARLRAEAERSRRHADALQLYGYERGLI